MDFFHQYLDLFIFLGLVVASFVLGGLLARALRMADFGWKFSLIIFAALSSAIIVHRGWPPKLGVDLGGGSILVYQVDPNQREHVDEKTMEQLVTSLSERINP